MRKNRFSPRRGRRDSRQYRRNFTTPSRNRLVATKLAPAEAAAQRSNICVVVRVRPPSLRENAIMLRQVVHVVDNRMIVFDPKDDDDEFFYQGKKQNVRNFLKRPRKDHNFYYDHVFGGSASNHDIFGAAVVPVLDTVLSGYNCSVFAYGATGAGKTYTMLGSEGNRGLTFLTVMELYSRLEAMKEQFDYEIIVSYLEVYNETVRDLLVKQPSAHLEIRENANGIFVPNLSQHKPKDSEQLMNLLARGNSVRSQHPTDHNAESSRSHAVFQICVSLRSFYTDMVTTRKIGKLVMVDLAGSEKGTATGFKGQRFREGASINLSLLSLANCINALADGRKHIPYRESKLTRILKDSLGGNCKTVMIANVSPSELCYEDSYNTLNYADRAKRIRCQIKENAVSMNAHVAQYTQVIEEQTRKIELLQVQLAKFETMERERLANKADVGTELSDSFLHITKSDMLNETVVISTSASVQVTDFSNEPVNDTGEIMRQLHSRHILSKELEDVFKQIQKIRADADVVRFTSHWKQRRLETIVTADNGISSCRDKVVREIDNHNKKLKKLEERELILVQDMRRIESQIQDFKILEQINETGKVVMSGAEFCKCLELHAYKSRVDGIKSANEMSYGVKFSNSVMETLINNEDTLERCYKLLGPTFRAMKHFGHTTEESQSDFDDVTSEILGTRVHWSNDVSSSSKTSVLLRELTNKHNNKENVHSSDTSFSRVYYLKS